MGNSRGTSTASAAITFHVSMLSIEIDRHSFTRIHTHYLFDFQECLTGSKYLPSASAVSKVVNCLVCGRRGEDATGMAQLDSYIA